MSTGAYDSLFGYYGGAGRSWYDTIQPAARAWLDGLADTAIERNKEPNWAGAFRLFAETFPDDAPDTDTTIKNTVRRLVNERG